MNVGLSNLVTLKAQLLAPAAQATTTWDPLIIALGQGVEAQMENFCDHKFARVVGDQFVCQGDRASFVLQRYPVEVISLVEFLYDNAVGWVSTGPNVPIIETNNPLSGVCYLQDDIDAGRFWNQIRITTTAGYFFEQLEPTDPGYPTAVPPTSFALPNDLFFAWILQCKRVWQEFDPLGERISESGSVQKEPADLELVPAVKAMLARYRRQQLV
ncbi:MAG: hypothetical protein ABSG59_18285 [Verrucomicrobiota bacterium]|jgi:hypothetical protein